MLYSHRPLLALTLALLLQGCTESDRVHSICADHPELCQDLVDDGWCRYERADVIRARYYLHKRGGDKEKYDLMKGLEQYRVCIERSTQVEYKRLKERKSGRVEGLHAAVTQLEQLDAQTRGSDNPWLLLWHWTNNTDEQARRKFIALEGSPQMEEPALQEALAGIYEQANPAKAINLLHHAISLHRGEPPFNGRLASSLSTLYMGMRAYEQAYLWAKVSEAFLDTPEISHQRLGIYATLSQSQLSELDDQAEQIAKQIKKGRYRPK